MNAVSSIASLLSLCGISSMRMFAPAFLFGAICRFVPDYSWCPDGVVKLAESCPAFLTSNFGLCVFGVLGILEIIANWDDSIRELISESNIETYVKPVFATLMTYSILTPEQCQAITTAVGEVTSAVPTDDAVSATIGLVTNVVSSAVASIAPEADPIVVTNAVSETVGIAAQRTAEGTPVDAGSFFSSVIASLFSCGGTFCLCKLRASFVAAVRELDPENSLCLNSLLTAFEEGTWVAVLPLLLVFPIVALLMLALLGLLGWLLSRPLRKLAVKRRSYWDSLGKERMLKAVRCRAMVLFILGVVLSVIPVFGYLATVVALNLLVFGVIALYEKPTSRLLAKVVMRFMKLTIFLVALVFSSIPFMGIVLLLPYVVAYAMRANRIRRS